MSSEWCLQARCESDSTAPISSSVCGVLTPTTSIAVLEPVHVPEGKGQKPQRRAHSSLRRSRQHWGPPLSCAGRNALLGDRQRNSVSALPRAATKSRGERLAWGRASWRTRHEVWGPCARSGLPSSWGPNGSREHVTRPWPRKR